jgi:LysM repeat protein
VNTLSRPRTGHLLLLLATLLGALWLAVGAARGATITVAPGDTLGAIAARSGTSVAALARANGISDPNRVRAGRRLVVPGGGGGGGASSGSGGGIYRVRTGDTLGSIASRNGVGMRALAAANGIADPNLIVVGQRLTIPGGGGGSTVAAAGGASYRVRPGDTMGAIAARHGTSVSALAALNGIRDPSMIAVGRLLSVPAGQPSASAPTSSVEVASLLAQHSARYGVDPALARAIAWQESRWSQSAVSSVGALGVMQLMPATAHWLGADVIGRRIDPKRLSDNIEGGVAYLAWLTRHSSSTRTAIGAYYQGLASLRQRGPYDDTQAYVASVLSFMGRV